MRREPFVSFVTTTARCSLIPLRFNTAENAHLSADDGGWFPGLSSPLIQNHLFIVNIWFDTLHTLLTCGLLPSTILILFHLPS